MNNSTGKKRILGLHPGMFSLVMLLILLLLLNLVLLSAEHYRRALSLPTPSPMPTNTPLPIIISVPPFTISPIFSPSPPVPLLTPNPHDLLVDAALHKFGDKLIGVTDLGEGLHVVGYNLPAVWDDMIAVDLAVQNFIDFTPVVFSIKGIETFGLGSFATFETTDGEVVVDTALSFVITRAVAEQINWEEINPHDIGLIMVMEEDFDVWINPVLMPEWLEYLQDGRTDSE